MIGFVDAIKLGLARYADFTGRSSRAEFWWWILFVVIGGFAGVIIDLASGLTVNISGVPVGIVGSLWNLAILMPNLAITARRLHDINRSGWWQLGAMFGWGLLLIPGLVFSILIFIWVLKKGDEGDNSHGTDPIQGLKG